MVVEMAQPLSQQLQKLYIINSLKSLQTNYGRT